MEILGLLDTLESMILEGFKIPFSKQTVINEEKVLHVTEKMRLVVQGGGGFVKQALDKRAVPPKQETIEFAEARREIEKVKESLTPASYTEGKGTEVIENAYKIAKEVRMGADKYADEVLSNLEATSSRILRAVKAGRSQLGKFVSKVASKPSEIEGKH